MKFAYADPPYIGQAKKHYSHDPRCAEVDHAVLIAKLEMEFDSWALSCSSTSLQQVLAFCPSGVRVGAWVKPFCAFKANVNPAYAWEPVIFKVSRRRSRSQETLRDWLSESITLKKGLVGVKPMKFSWWVFEFLNAEPADEFHDLFPGSGAVTEAWHAWRAIKQNGTGVLLKAA